MIPDEQRSVSCVIITKSILIHSPMGKKRNIYLLSYTQLTEEYLRNSSFPNQSQYGWLSGC